MTFPIDALCLTPERWMGLREQSKVGCFHELCCFQFFLARVRACGVANAIYKQVIFPTWVCTGAFNNNNSNNIFNLFF